MPEKADIYLSEAKTLEAKADALESTVIDLKKKKAAGKLDAVEQVDLDEGVQKLSELEAEKARYLQIAQDAVKASRPSAVATDYSRVFYYSQTLKKYLGLERPVAQLIFYVSSVASVIYVGKSFFQAQTEPVASDSLTRRFGNSQNSHV